MIYQRNQQKSNPLIKYMIDYHNDISYEINQHQSETRLSYLNNVNDWLNYNNTGNK